MLISNAKYLRGVQTNLSDSRQFDDSVDIERMRRVKASLAATVVTLLCVAYGLTRLPRAIDSRRLALACITDDWNTAQVVFSHGMSIDCRLADPGEQINPLAGLARRLHNGEQVTSAKYTPLMLAARYGSVSVAQELVKRHADLDFRNKDGYNALSEAINHNHYEIEELLDAAGARKVVRLKHVRCSGSGNIYQP